MQDSDLSSWIYGLDVACNEGEPLYASSPSTSTMLLPPGLTYMDTPIQTQLETPETPCLPFEQSATCSPQEIFIEAESFDFGLPFFNGSLFPENNGETGSNKRHFTQNSCPAIDETHAGTAWADSVDASRIRSSFTAPTTEPLPPDHTSTKTCTQRTPALKRKMGAVISSPPLVVRRTCSSKSSTKSYSDEADEDLVTKRARNTEAARRSRAKKLSILQQKDLQIEKLQALIREKDQELELWRNRILDTKISSHKSMV